MRRIHYCYLLTRSLPEGGSMYYVGIRTAPKGKAPETDTSYLGSGRWITRAVKAHRREFSKTILEVFDTRDEAAALERALVGLPTANSPWSYNLVTGGEDAGLASEETKARNRAAAKRLATEDPKRREQLRAMTEASKTPEGRAKNSAAKKRRLAEDPAAREQLRAMTAKATEASKTPENRAKRGAGHSRWWKDTTVEKRAARTAGFRRANERRRTEAQRRRREVALIFLALVLHNHGGAVAE